MTMPRVIGSLLSMRLVRDILTLQVGAVINIATALIGSIVYARLLGLSGYGQYAIALAFSGTASALFNGGQASALTTFLAEQHGRKSREGMGHVAAYYISMSALTGIILLAVAWYAPVLCAHLYGSTELGVLARLATLIVVLNAISGLFQSLFQTVREMRLYVGMEQGSAVAHLLLSSALLLHGGGVASVFQSKIALQLLSLPVFIVLYRGLHRSHVLPSLGQMLHLDGKSWREYFVQGIWIGIDKNVSNLFPSGLLSILRLWTSDAVVGLARIVFQLAMVPRSLLLNHAMQMSNTVLPALAAGGQTLLRQSAVKLLKHTLFLHTLISIACLVALPPAVLFFYGLPYSDAIVPSLWLILISILPAMSGQNQALFRLLRRTWLSTAVSLLALALSIAVLVACLPLTSSLNAVLLSTLAYYLTQQAATVILYAKLLRHALPKTHETVIDVPMSGGSL